MTSFKGLSIGLSVLFGCFFLALLAEMYYLLRWKKQLINTQDEDEQSKNNYYANEIVYLFCGQKRPTQETSRENQENPTSLEVDIELGGGRNYALSSLTEENVDLELMRLHNLSGPPRFLSTIKEETKEDLESDDGKSRSGRPRKSLNDIGDTQILSPLASPLHDFGSYNNHGFNPLFETSIDLDQYYKLRSSPPPTFKFLRDAEEKLLRKLVLEAEMKKAFFSECEAVQVSEEKSKDSTTFTGETEDKFVDTLIANADKDAKTCNSLAKSPSISSQVLPLASY